MKPQTAVIYSTNRNWAWGAPDYAWSQAVHRLLEAQIKVLGILHPEALLRNEVKELQKKGAAFYPQPLPQYYRGRIGQIKNTLCALIPQHYRRTRFLQTLKNAHIFINQGGDLDFLYEAACLNILDRTSITYDIIVNSTRYTPPLASHERTLAQEIINQSHRIYFNSQWTRDIVQNKLALPISKAEIFSYPVRNIAKKPLPWPEGNTAELACACRWDVFHKGLDVLLIALSQLKDHKQFWRLHLYGYGPESDTEYLKDLITYKKLKDRVLLHPFEKDVGTIWSQCHILLLTSRFEGFGVSMLDAMAYGRPVLRTPNGDAGKWIKHNSNGYLCPAAEPELITKTLDYALNNYPRWKSMGTAAHNTLLSSSLGDPLAPFLRPFNIEN
ncbi:MAG: glycosyltransferase family 4 protein [Verrucomicrobiota bacterium]